MRAPLPPSDERVLEQTLRDLDDQPARAFNALVELWRATRNPALGDLVEAQSRSAFPPRRLPGTTVDTRSRAWLELDDKRTLADVPTLLAALAVGRWELARERLERVAMWPDDPRVSSALVALLEQPPYRQLDALPFWEEVLIALVAIDDPRTPVHLARIAARPWPASIRAKDHLTPLLEQAARAAADRPPPLALGEVASRLRDELLRRVAPPPAAVARTAERLLADILERPDDHDLRRVYADVLIESNGIELRALVDEACARPGAPKVTTSVA